jgi:hypothetical protein
MSVVFRGEDEAGTVSDAIVEPNGALRVSPYSPHYIGSAGGKYRGELCTNLATVISAITATGDVGQIGQFRWASATKTCLVDYMKLSFASVTDATTLQRISLEVRKLSASTASASGGTTTAHLATVGVLTGDSFKVRNSYPTTALTDWRMTDTGDLTCGAGARAVDVQALFALHCSVPSAGATTDQIRHVQEWRSNGHPIVLTEQTGLSIINRVLWGAALTATVAWEIEWREILNEELPDF